MRLYTWPKILASWRESRGVSTLELALLGPLLTVLLLGAADLAGAIQQQLLLQQSVRAGALYAIQWPTDSSGIETAMTAALPAGWTNATVATPASSCVCVDSSGAGTAASSCTCASGWLQKLVTLSVSRPYSPYLLTTLSSTAASDVIRYQ